MRLAVYKNISYFWEPLEFFGIEETVTDKAKSVKVETDSCRVTEHHSEFGVILGVRTCEVFLCFVTIMFVLSIVLTSLFSLFYVTRELHRFLHRG